ncbi:MAG TPA: HAMP domain-containing sensor histidine kinase [Vicinamibacterales bacterium]|nr:HAMP domain-containing sensor histidine kinase [Vicinamibacterales bacterium]
MRIINDILDISKIEAGHLTLRQTPVVVSELVQLSRQNVDLLAQVAQVRLVTRLPEESPVVHVDRDRIVQALVNILSNAVKFAPPESTVTIEVSDDGHEVAIAVSDQGSGIADADLRRVFERFQQVDSSASRPKGGTGLGLAITKALVEQHGGRVHATSVVGQGARFTVVLPLAADSIVERRADG